MSISLTQLRGVVGRFLQEGLTLTSTDDVQNFIRFVSESIETGSALLLEEGRGPVQEQRSPSSESMTEIGAQYSSLGKVLSKPSLIPRTKSNKILPINHSQSLATAPSVLNSPDANIYYDNFNHDQEFENEKAWQMDDVPQNYTHEEDDMIAAASGLLHTLKMKGAIQFKPHKTTFSTNKHLLGFYNLKEGDIYIKSNYTHLNFGGRLPRVLVNNFIIPDFNRTISHSQVYFANLIDLANLSKDDGKLLEEILVNQVKTARKKGGWKKRAELGKIGVDQFLVFSVAMRELLPRYPWLRALLHEISLNQVKGARTVTTTLADLKDRDAIQLAKGLSTIILSNTEVSAAVDHWIAQNVALEEFEREYLWTRPLLIEIA
ncbi:hypothetical protein TL16_g05691 [Triparma laevis f. inornata]|uniref:Uncharacterized protein n=1 Tax=Triparma laevis f. inornata TaxID=1714386 RepID=A0A9W7AGS1_9STRA|nr:hypothetical protein TL16_g05691 [Triparma laevis f. inornata]